MPSMDWFLHGANILFAFSYAVRKILWLRVISVLGGLSFMVYFFNYSPPLMESFYWSLVFVVINSVHIGILLYEKRPLHFTEEEKRLFQRVFRTLTPIEFKKLLKLGSFADVPAKTTLVIKGQVLDRVLLIVSGRVSVEVDGVAVAELRDGQFIGEMAYLTGERASADVVARVPTRHLSWSVEPLRNFLDRQPSLQSAMQLIIGMDLVGKLKKRSD